MTLDTAEKMYRYFLSEIRKERTIVITPDRWNDMVNPIVIDWIKTKLPEIEFNQKRIDDLEAIKVITDGVSTDRLISVSKNTFELPFSGDIPVYMHGLSAAFSNHIDGKPDEPFIAGKILRSDKRVTILDNPYRQPDDKTFVYFEIRGNKLYCISDSKEFNFLILEYYSYPIEISYKPNIADIVGSFRPAQNKEIMDMAVTQYLEKASDQRIKTQPQVSAMVPK